jgi:peptidoglycan/LPS O-acetylase OafA/YrhL
MSDTEATTTEGRLIQTRGAPLGHVPSFDGLRGFFIVQVVLFHAEVTLFLKGSPILIDWFFVASGFLITTLLLDEWNKSGGINLRTFYTRRALRLFPSMYSMIAVFSLLMLTIRLLAPTETEDASLWWVESLSAALYVYNIVAAFFPGTIGILGYLWSLAVEEQFYFFWPPLFRRVLRRSRRRTDLFLIGGSLLFVAVFFFLRWKFQYVIETSSDTGHPAYADEGDITWQGVVYRIAGTRPDMIVWGCLVALVARKIPRPVPEQIRKAIAVAGMFGWALFAFVLVFCAPGPPGPLALFGGPVYQLGLLFIGAIVLDGYFRQESWYSKIFTIKPAQWLGIRAYSIYVWHGVVLLCCAPLIVSNYGLKRQIIATIASALAIGAGLLSHKFIDRRVMLFRNRRFASAARKPE